MSALGRLAGLSAVAPFRVRSFRYQWPADLLTSWAFEMEILILGWYVLVETGNPFMLALFGSVQFIGTLASPMFGVLGDRYGRRAMLCVMRGFYAVAALLIAALGLGGMLTPVYVILISLCVNMVRQSDLVMRNALIGDTMPPDRLMSAIGLNRTTADSARIAGALAGAGLFALLGVGPAYIVVVAFYLASLAFTFGVATARPAEEPVQAGAPPSSRWRDLTQGFAYVRSTPRVLALLWLAFLINLSAFPLTTGLLPYVAREVYGTGALGAGHLVAAYAAGALAGSLALAITGGAKRPGRFMLANSVLWYALLCVFPLTGDETAGLALLVVIGFIQSMAMLSMSLALIATTAERYRARVMGLRMLAVCGLTPGLLIAGKLINIAGFAETVWLYAAFGIAVTVLIGWRWRETLWR